MTNGFLRRQKATTVYVCAVVALLCIAILSSKAYAQEASTGTSASTTSPVTLAPASNKGYTTEFISSPSNVIPGDFVVGPGKTELTIEPGTSKTIEMLLTNRTGETREFNLEVEDATGTNDPATPVALLGDERGPYTLKDYIHMPQMRLKLEHNERARIPVTITVPADAEPGGRYGSVLVTTVSKDAVQKDVDGAAPTSAVISRVGTLFFLTIPGDTKVEGELKSFKTVPNRLIFMHGPINFQLLFENKGDLHLDPYGEIHIKNLFNEEVGFVELDPWFALPKSLRSREVQWNRQLLIGKYTATAVVNRGYDDIRDTESVTFWVMPWKVIAPVFGGLFLIFLFFRFISKNFEFKRKSN